MMHSACPRPPNPRTIKISQKTGQNRPQPQKQGFGGFLKIGRKYRILCISDQFLAYFQEALKTYFWPICWPILIFRGEPDCPVPLDDRQITHLICVRLKHLLYDFLGVFWASFLLLFLYKSPYHPLKKPDSKCFRRTQIRWVIWRSSSHNQEMFDEIGENDEFAFCPRMKTRPAPQTLESREWGGSRKGVLRNSWQAGVRPVCCLHFGQKIQNYPSFIVKVAQKTGTQKCAKNACFVSLHLLPFPRKGQKNVVSTRKSRQQTGLRQAGVAREFLEFDTSLAIAMLRLRKNRLLQESPPPLPKTTHSIFPNSNPWERWKPRKSLKRKHGLPKTFLGVKSLCLNCETKTFLLGQF